MQINLKLKEKLVSRSLLIHKLQFNWYFSLFKATEPSESSLQPLFVCTWSWHGLYFTVNTYGRVLIPMKWLSLQQSVMRLDTCRSIALAPDKRAEAEESANQSINPGLVHAFCTCTCILHGGCTRCFMLHKTLSHARCTQWMWSGFLLPFIQSNNPKNYEYKKAETASNIRACHN